MSDSISSLRIARAELYLPDGRIIDKNNPDTVYEFDGSCDTTMTIPKFDSRLTVEYKTCTQDGIPLDELKVGDGYLEVQTSTSTTYVPISLQAKTGSIQQISSVKEYYTVDTFSSIPSNGIYPVRLKDLKGDKYIALYSRDKNPNNPEFVAKVDYDTVYAILDTGLFGMLDEEEEVISAGNICNFFIFFFHILCIF